MPVLKYKDPETSEWKGFKVVDDGVTFIPAIDDSGVLSWTNDGHLPNPAPVNVTNNTSCLFDDYDDFPAAGSAESIYIDRKTGMMYRWDEKTNNYVSLKSSVQRVDIDDEWEELAKVKSADVSRLFERYYG